MDLPHGVRARQEGRLVAHDLLARAGEPLVEKVVEGQPRQVGEVIVGVPPAPPHGPLRPEPEVPAVGDGARERPGRHVRLNLPEVLPVPLPADEPSLPQAQHLRVRAEEPRDPRRAGLPVAHDEEDRRANLQDRPADPSLPPPRPLAGPALRVSRRPPGRRPRFGFWREVGAEPAQDLHAGERVGSGIRALLGLALTTGRLVRRGAQRNDGAKGNLRPYRPTGPAVGPARA